MTQRQPFTARQSADRWKRRVWLMLSWGTLVAAALTGSGCAPAVLSEDDAVALDGEPLTCAAYAEHPQILGLRSDIEHVTIRFFIDDKEVRRAETDNNGRAAVEFPLPRPGISTFEARAVVGGRELQTKGTIYAWRRGRPALAVDVDNTISHTEIEELLFKRRDRDSDPIPGSRETLSALARDFYVAYVTARPRIYVEKTRWWLGEHGFPPGPVVMTPRLRDLLRKNTVKRKILKGLRARWPDMLIGIGNNQHDADAYGASGMLSLIVNPNVKHAYSLHAIVLGDWAEVGRFFEANRDVLTSPEQIRKAVRGEACLRRCVIPWRETTPD